MNKPLGVSPSKGKQGTTRGKEKNYCPRWESNLRPPTELQGRTEKVGDNLDGESRRRESFSFSSVFNLSCSFMLLDV